LTKFIALRTKLMIVISSSASRIT